MPSERVKRHIDRLLDQLDDALEASDWPTVRRLASDVLRLDPGNEDADAFLEAAERDTDLGPAHLAEEAPTEVVEVQPAASLPSSFADGRYEVKRRLGVGGSKKVYLAHDTVLDRAVAFALIKIESLDE